MRRPGPWLAWMLLASLGVPALAAAPRTVSPQKDIREAVQQARKGHLDAAFLLANAAAAAAPKNQDYATVRELLRQRALFEHLRRAHTLVLARNFDAAAVQYRWALSLDPDNADARTGLAELFPLPRPRRAETAFALRVQRAAPPVELAPTPGVHAFRLRTGLRQAVARVAAAYGMQAYVANNVPQRTVRLDLGDASFADAMAALRAVAGLGYIPLGPHTLYFANRGELDRIEPLATRTFYVPWAQGATGLQQIESIIKDLLAVKQITPDAAGSALSIRATPAQLDAVEQLLLDLGQQPAQVMLQIKILSLSSTVARSLGLSEPSQFTMFALGPLLAQLEQSGGEAQTILNLFEQGGLSAVLNSGALSSSELSQAQSQLSPLLQNPFVTFGGGATLMALSVPPLSAQFHATESRAVSIETGLLRARSGESAELKVGQRYPVINASFSPISLSPAIESDIASGGFIEPFPSFTYENLGLDAKITPVVERDGNIHLKLDLSVESLAGSSINDIPVLSDRHVETNFTLHSGEPMVIAGLFTRQEMRTLSGLPGLSLIPGLRDLFSTSSRQTNGNQLALEITGYLVRLPPHATAAIGLPASFAEARSSGSVAPPRRPPLVPPAPKSPSPARPAPASPAQNPAPGPKKPAPQPNASPNSIPGLGPIYAPPRTFRPEKQPPRTRPSAAPAGAGASAGK